MDIRTYVEESERTLSDQFHDDKVDDWKVEAVLQEAVTAGDLADQLKKLLFYGKPSAALNMMPTYWRNPTTDLEFEAQYPDPDLLHAALGMFTEAAELLQAILKSMQGKEMDKVNLREELGDLMWYVALMSRTTGDDLEDVMARNIEKLRRRYPEKFTTEAAVTRNTVYELEAVA